MNTGTLIYIITMGWSLLIIGGLTYLLVKKKDYTLISGFSKRSDKEKEYLAKSGYLDALSKLLHISFWIFFITFILGLLSVPYGMEIGLVVFVLVLMIGIIFVQRYEVPHKRKKMLWIMSIISAATILFIGIIVGIGYMENEIKVENDTFTITKMYGVEWDIADIHIVELLEEHPNVISKTDGFATSGILKGRFVLEKPYGKGKLFIQNKSGPFLYIETKEEYVIISRKDPADTEELYYDLLRVTR